MSSLTLVNSSQFKKDFKKFLKSDLLLIIEIGNVIGQLSRAETLNEKYRDHNLTGNWQGFREYHIKPDVLLIYQVISKELHLARLGSHAELF